MSYEMLRSVARGDQRTMIFVSKRGTVHPWPRFTSSRGTPAILLRSFRASKILGLHFMMVLDISPPRTIAGVEAPRKRVFHLQDASRSAAAIS